MSDDSIIEKTPEKKKIKKTKHKARKIRAKFTEENNSQFLSQLVSEFERNITQKSTTTNLSNSEKPTTSTSEVSEKDQKIITESKSEDLAFSSTVFLGKNDQDEEAGPSTSETIEKSYPLTDTIHSPISKNPHKLYIFYLLDELIEFSPNHFPKNCHIQVVGILKLYEQDYFLISLEQVYWKSTKIKLNLTNLATRPDCDSLVTIFGVLTFDKNDPIIVVQFFQAFTVNYKIFKKIMLRLRTTVPLENFEMVKNNDIDLSLNQEELSFDGELGDQTLDNFLDEISFEKL